MPRQMATQESPSQSHRWLIVTGGLICFAAMWLPLFETPLLRSAFVPIEDEYGYACWLWLLIPVLGLARTGAASRSATVLTRAVLIAGGTVGTFAVVGLALAFESPIALIFLPASLAVLVIGIVGRGIARLIVLIAAATLIACAFLYDSPVRSGLAVLALGGFVLLIGGALWSRRDNIIVRESVAAPLPRAVAP